MFGLTDAIYHDANAARDHLEAVHWPNGPVCPPCGEDKRVTRLTAATARAGFTNATSAASNSP